MVKFIILNEQRLIIERFTKHVNFSAIEAASYAIWSHPDYNPKYNGLVDLRGCTVAFDIKELGRVASFFFKSAATSKGFIVILADNNQAIARSYILNNRVSRFMKIHISSDFESAMKNLKINKEIYEHINSERAIEVELIEK